MTDAAELVTVGFEYNEVALWQLKAFVKKRVMRWNQGDKTWTLPVNLWNAFVESLDDANLAWRSCGYSAPEICDALTVLRAATVRPMVTT